MKNYMPVLALTGMALSFPCNAINVGEITSIMTSDEKILAKEIANNTQSARYVSVTVQKLSSPLANGKIIKPDTPDELLSTPANLILPGDAKDNFRFIYNGPADDKERYYRLVWVDEPISATAKTNASKSAVASTSAEIGTILVVAPRKERFDYQYAVGTVTNTGNVSFRVIAYGPCKNKAGDQGNGCRERYYILPGNKKALQYTDTSNSQSRVGIWHGKQLITVK